MTFCLTRSREIDEKNVVTTEEINQYKQTLEYGYRQYGFNVTDEEINKQVQEYKYMRISMAKSDAKGMELKDDLKISVITSFIFCIILFIAF